MRGGGATTTPRPSPLTHRERAILVCAANGMRRDATARTLLLTPDQVYHARQRAYRKLGIAPGTSAPLTRAVVIAWRLCLIEADEIEGDDGPPPRDDDGGGHFSLAAYRESVKRLPPPNESWEELRERARRMAAEYRQSKMG